MCLGDSVFFIEYIYIYIEASLGASKTSILLNEGKDLLSLDFQKSDFLRSTFEDFRKFTKIHLNAS